MHYIYIFHFIVKSYVHWCPTELVLGLLMSGILPLSYRKQIQLCGPDILSLSYGHLSYWQRFVFYPRETLDPPLIIARIC